MFIIHETTALVVYQFMASFADPISTEFLVKMLVVCDRVSIYLLQKFIKPTISSSLCFTHKICILMNIRTVVEATHGPVGWANFASMSFSPGP